METHQGLKPGLSKELHGAVKQLAEKISLGAGLYQGTTSVVPLSRSFLSSRGGF